MDFKEVGKTLLVLGLVGLMGAIFLWHANRSDDGGGRDFGREPALHQSGTPQDLSWPMNPSGEAQ